MSQKMNKPKLTHYLCPACNKATPKKKWTEEYEECELCGPGQKGMGCPRFMCRAVFTDCTDWPKEVSGKIFEKIKFPQEKRDIR